MPPPSTFDPALAAFLLAPAMPWFAFVFGALWGSFSNVVIYRVPLDENIAWPRSYCPGCGAQVASYDNVPILSYLWLRGRCRGCRAPIGLRYLVVELLGGMLSFALYFQLVYVPLVSGLEPRIAAFFAFLVFGLALLCVAYIDLDHWIIPNAIVFPVAALGFLLSAWDASIVGTSVTEGLGVAVAAYAVFAGIRWFYLRFRGLEALGLGDAKLLVMVAAFLGARGVLWTVAAGAVQGLLVAVPLLLLGREVASTPLEEVHGDDPELGHEDPNDGVMGRRVPFGPFLAIAALEYVLLAPNLEPWFQAVLSW